MFKAKKTIMYIDVKGVDDMTDRRDLMREVIRRNCDVDSRIIDSLVDKLGSCGDKDHKKCEYQLRLENYDLGGIARDFELLKKAGIIEHVTKPPNYIVLYVDMFNLIIWILIVVILVRLAKLIGAKTNEVKSRTKKKH